MAKMRTSSGDNHKREAGRKSKFSLWQSDYQFYQMAAKMDFGIELEAPAELQTWLEKRTWARAKYYELKGQGK